MMALPRNFIIGIIVFCIFIVGGVYLFTSIAGSSATVNDFNSTFSKVDEITAQTNEIRDNIVNSTTDFGLFGVLNSLINSAWTGVKVLFSTVELGDTVVTETGNFVGLPPAGFTIAGLIILIIIIFVSFSIWSAIFQRDL